MPDSEPDWVTVAEVLEINRDAVAKTGEDHAVLSQTGLAGAIERPRNLFLYEEVSDVITLGVRLIEGIGKGHCFIQGNKRTAFIAGISFIEQKGVVIQMPDTERNAELIRKLIVGEASAEELESVLRHHAY